MKSAEKHAGSQHESKDNTSWLGIAWCEEVKIWLQELRQRIRDTYEARWKAEKHFDEESILEELPGSLRIEVPRGLCPCPRFGISALTVYQISCYHTHGLGAKNGEQELNLG